MGLSASRLNSMDSTTHTNTHTQTSQCWTVFTELCHRVVNESLLGRGACRYCTDRSQILEQLLSLSQTLH